MFVIELPFISLTIIGEKFLKFSKLSYDTIYIQPNYKNLDLSQAFVFRPAGSKEDPPSSETELSRQLHGAVRTNNLETSLRLLSQGANPNYFHPEKNNSTALHIACKSGQTGQVELLLVFGSDPGAIDKNGRTPSDYAK